jgi:hypothetical protein
VIFGKASGPATVSVNEPRATDLLPSNRREAISPSIKETQEPVGLERGFQCGVIAALRKAANKQERIAADGTFPAGPKYPGVEIRSPEGARAARLAMDWAEIADALDRDCV